MTAQEIADRLLTSEKGVTPERVAKAKALATRAKVPWDHVQALLPKSE